VNLPDLRIVVEPDRAAIIFRWKWRVEKAEHRRNSTYWPQAHYLGPFDGPVKGNARTRDRAIRKARKAAASYCEDFITIEKRRAEQREAKFIERVTCDGS
jgi:hypothetical protein